MNAYNLDTKENIGSHRRDPQHPTGSISGQQKSRKDVIPKTFLWACYHLLLKPRTYCAREPRSQVQIFIYFPYYSAKVPPTHGSRVNYYNGPFTVHSHGFIFKCQCTFYHVVNILCPADGVIRSDPRPEVQMVLGVLINVLLTLGVSFFDIEILKYISPSLESLG